MVFVTFNDYPLEKAAVIMTTLNPIDLSRVMILLKLDISALMGYTAAVFNQFFGTTSGMIISLLSLSVWVVLPIVLFNSFAKRKDF
jgi:Cu-processing system permease protein